MFLSIGANTKCTECNEMVHIDLREGVNELELFCENCGFECSLDMSVNIEINETNEVTNNG